jgi:hypothetical protein
MERAVAVAVALAREHGLDPERPVVISDRQVVLVHLAPAPVLARVGVEDVFGPRLDWQRGAVSFVRYLADRGAPVVPPSELLPPGPFEVEGMVVSFWRFAEDRQELPLDPRAAGEGLRRIHELGLAYDGELAAFWPPSEAEALLERAALTDDERELLRRTIDRIALPERPQQPLHGDAHIWNCVRTPDGPLWIDFDEACRGPLEWDAATMIESSLVSFGLFEQVDQAYEAAFGDRFTRDELAPFVELRVVLIAEWLGCHLPRYPAAREELDRILAWLRALE